MSTFYINASANDGFKRTGGSWDYTDVVLDLGSLVGDTHQIALRFVNVNIPQGSTINSATLKGYKSGIWDQDGSESVRSKIYGIDEDNTSSFTSDPLSRTKTTASVDWDFQPQAATTSHTSPSITSVIQEIVDRAGWASGNAMGFIITDDGSDEVGIDFYSYDDANPFELTVTWSSPTSTSTTTNTSSSSTSSSSTTTMPSVSTTSDINYSFGFKIMKEGKPIDSKIADDYYFTSKYPGRSIKKRLQIEVPTNTGSDPLFAEVGYTHDFGYKPQFIAFTHIAEINPATQAVSDGDYFNMNFSDGGAYNGSGDIYEQYLEVYVTDTEVACKAKLEWFVPMSGTTTGIAHTYTFDIILFMEEIEQ